LFLITFSLLLPLLLFTQVWAGGTGSPTGIVPCGTETCPCELCDFFVMFDKIIDFFLLPPTGIVPLIATLILMIGGVMFFVAAGNPEKLTTAKSLLTSVVIGLVIIYGAWIFINTFFIFIGVADWTGLREGWFSFPCP